MYNNSSKAFVQCEQLSHLGLCGFYARLNSIWTAKPYIENWIVDKFRQPCDDITLDFNGLTYPLSDIEIVAQVDREKEIVDIYLFIRNMNNDQENYKNLAFLYLDHILGEYNTLTKVGYIEFHNLDQEKTVEDSLSLLQLRELIAKELY